MSNQIPFLTTPVDFDPDTQYFAPQPAIQFGAPLQKIAQSVIDESGNTWYATGGPDGNTNPTKGEEPSAEPTLWKQYAASSSGSGTTVTSETGNIGVLGSAGTGYNINVNADVLADNATLFGVPGSNALMMAKPLSVYYSYLSATVNISATGTPIGPFTNLFNRYTTSTPPYTAITYNSTTNLFTVGGNSTSYFIINITATAGGFSTVVPGTIELRLVNESFAPLNANYDSIILANPASSTATNVSTKSSAMIVCSFAPNATFQIASGAVNNTCTLNTMHITMIQIA